MMPEEQWSEDNDILKPLGRAKQAPVGSQHLHGHEIETLIIALRGG